MIAPGIAPEPLRQNCQAIHSLWMRVLGDTIRSLAACSAAILFIRAGETAHGEVNPYAEIIATRNVFGLKDPPPPPPPPDSTPPAQKITLIGIANVLGVKKAVLKPQAAPGAPGKPPIPGSPPPGQEPPLVLTEGAMQDGITVVSIDEDTGTVKVDNNGQELTLSFAKDGLKVPSGPAAPAPGVAGLPGGLGQPGIPRPPGMAGLVTAAGMPGFQPGGMPTPGAVPNAAGLVAPGSQGGFGTPVAGASSVGGGLPSQGGLPQRPVRTLSPEEYAVMYEANREKNRTLTEAGLLPKMPQHPFFRDPAAGGAGQPVGK